jgi:predicted MFS family arabinose efflux permease
MSSDTTQPPARLAPTLVALTLARLVINGSRRFLYFVLTPMAAALGVPRELLEQALALQWATGMLSPLTTPAGERFGRKRVMLVAIGSLALVGLVAAARPLPEVIVVAVIASGVSKMIFDPAMQAYIGDRTPYHRRGTAIGVTELAWSGALFIAGPLAAYLLVRSGVGAIYAVLAGGGLIAFGLLLWLLPGDVPRPGPHGPARLSFGASLALLGASRPAVAVLAAAALLSLGAEIMQIVFELWLVQRFALPPQALGSLAFVFAGAEVAGEAVVIAFADRAGKRRLALAALVLAGLSYLVVPFAGARLEAAVAALFLMFFLFEVAIVVMIPLATEVLPGARGLMMTSNVAALAGGRALGARIGGGLYRAGGYPLNGALALGINLLAVLLVWRFVVERGAERGEPPA